MDILLVLIGISLLIDIAWLLSERMWRRSSSRTILAALQLFLATLSGAGLLAIAPSWATALVAIIQLYRALNYGRIAFGRMNHHALRRVGRRSLAYLGAALVVSCGAVLLRQHGWLTPTDGVAQHLILAAAGLACLAAAGLLISTLYNLRHTRPRTLTGAAPLRTSQLPSVTVAIPARNETQSLLHCLDRVVASDYQKLEILVLDDDSHNKRTPEIIRSFAHDGVRFLQGDRPRDGWLAKNQAYNTLAEQANGELILFMGVDILLEPNTIRQLVDHAYAGNKSMLSVLPQRDASARSPLSLTQAGRYMWELALPRKLVNRPPVLSSCWLISRHFLKQSGGLKAVRRSVTPEAYFARQAAHLDGYSFVRATQRFLHITSTKSRREQAATARRVRYPALHRRIEIVALLSAAYLALLLLTAGVVGAYWANMLAITRDAALLSGLAYLCFAAAFAAVSRAARLNAFLIGLLLFPFSLVQDLLTLHASLWSYEFGSVTWKQRDVTAQVMHVTSHLPPLG